MNQITFTARPIHEIPVKKLVDNKYEDISAYFVEMEQSNEADKKSNKTGW